MRNSYLSSLLFLSLFLFVFAVSVQLVRNYAQVKFTMQTVTYCTPAKKPQLMDIYTPSGNYAKPLPVVVYVHGGAWTSGSKGPPIIPSFSNDTVLALVDKGFVVASINYRLLPDNKFPAMIQDVKCSIRFLRAKSVLYGIDPNRIGILGHSAGGHLASLAGLADKSVGWDKGEYLSQSSDVKAVADLSGPSDLSKPQFYGVKNTQEIILFLGGGNLVKTASPVTYVSKTPNTDPPFLIIHGDKDASVDIAQSKDFHNKLIANGQHSTLLIVKNANHNFLPASSNALLNPSRASVTSTIVKFFMTHLGTPVLLPTPVISSVPTPTPTITPMPVVSLSATPEPSSFPSLSEMPSSLPTSEITSVLSPTPIPTTFETGDVNISFSIKLPGIGLQENNSPKRLTRTINATVYDERNEHVASGAGVLTYDSSAGMFIGIIPMGILQEGTYYLKVKSDNTLQTLMIPPFQKLVVNKINSLVPVEFAPIDINQDNKVSLKDFDVLVNCFQKNICKNTTDTDFNDDGQSNVIDYNIFLNNYSQYGGD